MLYNKRIGQPEAAAQLSLSLCGTIPQRMTMKRVLAKTLKFLSVSLLLALNLACAQEKVDLQKFIENPYSDTSAVIPPDYANSIDDLIAALGKPIEIEETKEYTAVWNGQEDDRQALLTYDDIYLLYYYSSSKQQYMLFLFQITKPKYELKYGIRIGMPEGQLTKKLGEPLTRFDNGENYELVYNSPAGQCTVNFSFISGKLNAVNIHLGD